MTAAVVCGACGTGLRAAARFCDRCGAPTGVAAEPAEYKQVTVLFADVVRSMGLAAVLDAERFREVMTELAEQSAWAAEHYGGTVEYTGDGVMAVFGAPVALEDHAVRACLAALDIQQRVRELAAEVERRDGVDLRLRVGVNSGQVIVGEIGSGSLGYGAVGEAVGFAQRMESVAPSGGVLVSESTARLVEHVAVLAGPERVRVKGADEPVCARRLLAIGPSAMAPARTDTTFVGRRWEMAALEALLDQAVGGRGAVVHVLGPPGIGKSRVAREIAGRVAGRGIGVRWVSCESHAREVPLHTATRLLRAGLGVTDLAADAARARVRDRVGQADPDDLLLLDEMLGIADPDVPVPQINPDARRRRVTALINATTRSRTDPLLFIVDDAQWIDAVSESLLADLLAVVPKTPTMVLITSRPEYQGTLLQIPGAQTIAIAPLGDSETESLVAELLGSDPSVAELSAVITARSAGNPFFAEEMVRELVQRTVLSGARGRLICRVDVTEVSVPVTVQAAIEARVDLLGWSAKQTLHAASAIGEHFDADLLAELGIDPQLDELVSAELVEPVQFAPGAEYTFRHPLIRAVAYESQLRSDRADWHRRLAAAIEKRAAASGDESAARIAQHLQAAGDLHAAYGWHMRAATWSSGRDLGAARISWERACQIADRLAGDDPELLSMRIVPRSMLCATDWQARPVQETWGRFTELRELCTAGGDKVSLAIGMSGLAAELLYAGRPDEGSRLAAEQMELLESIGDPDLTVGLALVAFVNWFNVGKFGEILRLAQTVVDLAGGDLTKGSAFGLGSPLAVAVAFRGAARWWLGRPGWREDFHDSAAMARTSDPATLTLVVCWTSGLALIYGAMRADDPMLRTMGAADRYARETSNDYGLAGAQLVLGVTLLCRESAADRDRGLELLTAAIGPLHEHAPSLLPVAEVFAGRERARRGDRDAAIPAMRDAVDTLHRQGRPGWGVASTGLLVEALVERGSADDLADAQTAIDWLADLPREDGSAVPDITLLHAQALVARARSDDEAFRDVAARYLAMAESLGFDGHIAWARAMVDGRA